jgi:hypothetical protein
MSRAGIFLFSYGNRQNALGMFRPVTMHNRRNVRGLGSRALAKFAFFARCPLAALFSCRAYNFALCYFIGPGYYSERAPTGGPMFASVGQTIGGYHTSGRDNIPGLFINKGELMAITRPALGVS